MTKTKALVAAFAVLAAIGTAPALAQDNRPVLDIGVQNPPPGFDPSMNISNAGQRVTASIFDKLIARAYWEGENGDGAELVPSIATAWRQVSDTEWEVDIRTDVVFRRHANDGRRRGLPSAATSCGAGPHLQGRHYLLRHVQRRERGGRGHRQVHHQGAGPDLPGRFTSPLGMVVPRPTSSKWASRASTSSRSAPGPKLAEFARRNRAPRLTTVWGGCRRRAR